jgi:hypothetical protein
MAIFSIPVHAKRDIGLHGAERKSPSARRAGHSLERSLGVALASGMHAKVTPAKTGGSLGKAGFPSPPVQRPAGAPNKCALQHGAVLSRSND